MLSTSQARRSAGPLLQTLEPRRLLSATMDISSNAIVVDYRSDGGPLVHYYGGAWSGPSIVSGAGGVGYAEANDVSTVPIFGSIDASAVLLLYTRYGDANLDSTVNLADFNALVSNFGPGSGLSYREIAYRGVVNLGQPAYFVEGRTLVVLGSPKDDEILVDTAKLDEMKRQFPHADIRRISVDAGAGDDRVEIQVGLISTVSGARGNDTIFGSSRGDHLSGGAGDDEIHGSRGDDMIEGLDGYDVLYGGFGNDSLVGGKGHDMLFGNDGDDVLFGGGGSDWFYGGAGADQFKTRDVAGNRDHLGFDGRFDVLLNSDPDDEMIGDAR